MKNNIKQEEDIQPLMILTIDIGDGHVDKLQLYDLNNIEQETYDFCVKNKLDFNTMQEINTQIQNVLKDKRNEEEHQKTENEFPEIKEEDEEKNTENNLNEIGEKESIIINNSNELDSQKENNNEIISDNNKNINKEKINIKNNINSYKEEKKIEDTINNNNLNSNKRNNINNNNLFENRLKKINKHSIRINKGNKNNSSYSYDKYNKKSKSKKKNIKDNIKEAFAIAKEKLRFNNKSFNKENSNINNNEMNNTTNEKLDKKIESNDIKIKNDSGNKNNEKNNNIINNNVNQNNKNKKKEKDEIKNKKNNLIENNKNENNIEKNDNVNKENIRNNIINEEKNYVNENDNNNNNKIESNIIIEENKIENNNSIKNDINQKNNNENENNKDNLNKQLSSNINQENNNSRKNQMNKKKNKSISHNGSYISGYNPGKGLYERGLKFIENEKEKLEALKRNLEVDELEDNTFFPKINKLSENQIERIREKVLECTNPDIIKNYREYKQIKMEILKQKTDEEFYKICTFKPCINRTFSNTKIVKNKLIEENNIIKEKIEENNIIKNESRFDKLYNYRLDYKENKDKLKEKIYNEYSFKPQINENSSFYKLNIPFNKRLETYSNKTKENMLKIQKIYERELGYNEPFKPNLNNQKNKILLKDIDEFFLNEVKKYKINLGENSKNNDNDNKNNYIDHYTKLYLYGKKYEQEKNSLTEKYYQNQNKSPQFCDITEEIINKKKEKSFRQIFKLLDADEDSKISATHMNTSKLPKNISKILEPIFNELKEENETLNELEFIFVCDQLYLSLPWKDKRELTTFEDIVKKNLKKEQILKEKNNYSFKPKINKRNYSYERQTKLYDRVGRYKEVHKNNEISNYNNIFNKSHNNYTCINNNNDNYNYYKYNKKNKKNKVKNNKNQINNKVNYFNLKISNQNSDNKKTNNKYNYINNNKDKYTILKNININIEGKCTNINKEQKKSKKMGRKINYDNFINVKSCS